MFCTVHFYLISKSWGAITSRRPHAVALESRAASKHNHLQPLPAVQSPAVAASAVAVKSPTRPAAAAAAEEKANDPNNERVASDQSALTNEPASPDVPAADSEAAPVRVEAAPVGAQAGAVENEAAIGTGSGTGATAAAVAAATRPDEDAPDTTACVWQVELVYLPQAAPMERARQAQLAEAAQEQAEGAHRQQGCVAASNALAGAFREVCYFFLWNAHDFLVLSLKRSIVFVIENALFVEKLSDYSSPPPSIDLKTGSNSIGGGTIERARTALASTRLPPAKPLHGRKSSIVSRSG